jgi:ankyrin repeat protein
VATRHASLELLTLLIDHAGFSVNVREGLRHHTPLHEAVRHSVEPAAAYLLDRGADTALISVRAQPPSKRPFSCKGF